MKSRFLSVRPNHGAGCDRLELPAVEVERTDSPRQTAQDRRAVNGDALLYLLDGPDGADRRA